MIGQAGHGFCPWIVFIICVCVCVYTQHCERKIFSSNILDYFDLIIQRNCRSL